MRGFLLLLVLLVAGCSSIDPMFKEMPPYAPDVAPDDFVAGIDNPYLPFVAGATWTYYIGAPEDFEERIELVVLAQPKDILGVQATVVRDTVYGPGGAIIEDTHDWFAQDKDGNVWYLGEETCEYEGGQCIDTGGSFQWGVDGALPGIVMHADPQPGEPYYQEYYAGEAVDRAEVMGRGESVTTPLGAFTDTVRTREWNPLHPDEVERVFYVRGIGVVIKGVYDDGRFDEPETLYSYDVPGFGSGTA